MSTYTTYLEAQTYDIFETEDYFEELKKAADLFRTFDKALDTFILEHGYTGDADSAEDKVNFISDKLKDAGVPIPRNIKKWYSQHKTIERKTAFQICFAFHLQVNEVDDFLRRICLTRGFDCHSVEEVIYFFAFKKGLSYREAQDIIEQVELVKPARMAAEDVIYTNLIVDEIDEIETAEELVVYLNENAYKFAYNNATAYNAIQTIWENIAKQNGIAIREKRLLYPAFNKDGETEDMQKKRKERKRVDDSIWEIYLQILGLSGNYVADFYKDRSLKPIFKDNALLHPLAEDSFPDRDGLTKILRGEHVSYERVRKILILLVFYSFWAEKAVKNRSYGAEYGDTDRCILEINNHLTDAGYPMLYPGNPYDFIIFVAVNEENPLVTFREYMREMFYEKSKAIKTEYGA